MSVLRNIPLLAGALGWFVAEVLKMIVKAIRRKSLKGISWKDLFSSGGMPSSHSGAVCALTAALFMVEGPLSPSFADGVSFRHPSAHRSPA